MSLPSQREREQNAIPNQLKQQLERAKMRPLKKLRHMTADKIIRIGIIGAGFARSTQIPVSRAVKVRGSSRSPARVASTPQQWRANLALKMWQRTGKR